MDDGGTERSKWAMVVAVAAFGLACFAFALGLSGPETGDPGSRGRPGVSIMGPTGATGPAGATGRAGQDGLDAEAPVEMTP